jgi:hypothetical protein
MTIAEVLEAFRSRRLGAADARASIERIVRETLGADGVLLSAHDLGGLSVRIAESILGRSRETPPGMRAVSPPPAEGAALVDQRYTLECRDGQWVHVLTEVFRRDDGSEQTVVSRSPTGMPCHEKTSAIDARAATEGRRPSPPRVLGTQVTVVSWIPYLPVGPLLRTAAGAIHPWYTEMDAMEEELLRSLLATGNPDPPASFESRGVFDAFVASREYRAIMHVDLSVTCEEGRITHVERKRENYAGFTPARAEFAPGDGSPEALVRFHATHESEPSRLRRNDARRSIGPDREPPYPEPESYTAYTVRATERGPAVVSESANYWAKLGFQVANGENFAYAVRSSGYVLPYWWCEIGPLRLDPTGEMTLTLRGSGLPSHALYVDGLQVARADMLAQSWNQIWPGLFGLRLSEFPELAAAPWRAVDAPAVVASLVSRTVGESTK